MAKSKPSAMANIYRLKITLRDVKPPIWRRIEVPGNARLDQLSLMIQAAMGWTNSHLHSFSIDGADYGMHHDEFESDLLNERDYRFDELISREKVKLHYTYDFGDNWEHDVLVEKITPPEMGVKYPRCTDGSRACPPEDVGSVWGYAEFLKAIRDPKHDDHETFLEWVGGKFDPEAFDVNEVDAIVKDFKSMQVMI